MKVLSPDDLQALLAPHAAPCVSIFLPTHRAKPDSVQNPIRLKNRLREAERLLHSRFTDRDTAELLAPVEALLEPEFQRDPSDALAIFRSRDHFVYYRLPRTLKELTVVADSFHVKPLLGFLSSNRSFYLLALSQHGVTLYEGSPSSLVAVNLAGLPPSLSEALGIEHHRSDSGRTFALGSSPAYQGRGSQEVSNHDELARYFRIVDRALWELLKDRTTPLILAGVERSLSIFRENSRYRHIAASEIDGNVERDSRDALHARAWPIAKALFDKADDDAVAEYRNLANRSLVADILTDVAKAALQGKVRKLFLGEGKRLFGRLDPTSAEVTLHGEQVDTRDDDVLDDLAEAVLLRGGEVLVIPQEKMPGDAAAAAILRW